MEAVQLFTNRDHTILNQVIKSEKVLPVCEKLINEKVILKKNIPL